MEKQVDISKLLRQHGIRPSVQRIAIMEYLLTHRTHPTADEIYAALAVKIPTLSKTTVYNTLTLFVAQGAATHITIDARESRFDGDTALHGHFLCTECGALYDVFFESPTRWPVIADHSVTQVQLYYKGVCKHCLSATEESEE